MTKHHREPCTKCGGETNTLSAMISDDSKKTHLFVRV